MKESLAMELELGGGYSPDVSPKSKSILEALGEPIPMTGKVSRREARSLKKEWTKNYQKTNDCSRKEARAAYKEQVGDRNSEGFLGRVLSGIDILPPKISTISTSVHQCEPFDFDKPFGLDKW